MTASVRMDCKHLIRICVIAATIFVSALAIVLLQPPALRAQLTSSDGGNAKAGESLYIKANCYTCHGTVGQGGAGPRIGPNPLPAAAFVNFVRKGTPGWSLVGGMPSFPPAVLSDANLADVRAFLASIPAPPPAKNVPLLN